MEKHLSGRTPHSSAVAASGLCPSRAPSSRRLPPLHLFSAHFRITDADVAPVARLWPQNGFRQVGDSGIYSVAQRLVTSCCTQLVPASSSHPRSTVHGPGSPGPQTPHDVMTSCQRNPGMPTLPRIGILDVSSQLFPTNGCLKAAEPCRHRSPNGRRTFCHIDAFILGTDFCILVSTFWLVRHQKELSKAVARVAIDLLTISLDLSRNQDRV